MLTLSLGEGGRVYVRQLHPGAKGREKGSTKCQDLRFSVELYHGDSEG